eukprot:358232-Chlamydomonas_euryale.AAC.2
MASGDKNDAPAVVQEQPEDGDAAQTAVDGARQPTRAAPRAATFVPTASTFRRPRTKSCQHCKRPQHVEYRIRYHADAIVGQIPFKV